MSTYSDIINSDLADWNIPHMGATGIVESCTLQMGLKENMHGKVTHS